MTTKNKEQEEQEQQEEKQQQQEQEEENNNTFENDKIKKQNLVLKIIKSYCTKSSPIKELRYIAERCCCQQSDNKNNNNNNGDNNNNNNNIDELQIENLSGGYTNYTYKVYLPSSKSKSSKSKEEDDDDKDDNSDSDSDVTLFAKLCFNKALWNPNCNLHYDVKRITNEYIMMKKFNKLISPIQEVKGCVAEPYLLIDIKEDNDDDDENNNNNNMKLLVAQWSPGGCNEQLANQFIDEYPPDLRIAKKLAIAVSSLHCCSIADTNNDNNNDNNYYNNDYNYYIIDSNFNTESRECMISLFSTIKEYMMTELNNNNSNNNNNNRVTKLANDYGKEILEKIVNIFTMKYKSKEILVHGDLHAFNCLVEEKKPNVNNENINEFGLNNNGSIVICDWEMSMVGPLGLDNGRIFSIPIACALVHAINGIDDACDGNIKFIDTYWNEYVHQHSIIKTKKKKEQTITTTTTTTTTKKESTGGKTDNDNDDENDNDDNNDDDDVFMKRNYISTMGWLGWKLYLMSTMKFFIPYFTIEKNDIPILIDSLGVIGLKLMHWGFLHNNNNDCIDDDNNNDNESLSLLSLNDLQCKFYSIIQNEINIIKQLKHNIDNNNNDNKVQSSSIIKRRRRSSILRQTNRRVSDSSIYNSSLLLINKNKGKGRQQRPSFIMDTNILLLV